MLSQDNSIEGEVCPDGLVIVEEIARRIKRGGGAALIADYGDNHLGKLTLRVRLLYKNWSVHIMY